MPYDRETLQDGIEFADAPVYDGGDGGDGGEGTHEYCGEIEHLETDITENRKSSPGTSETLNHILKYKIFDGQELCT